MKKHRAVLCALALVAGALCVLNLAGCASTAATPGAPSFWDKAAGEVSGLTQGTPWAAYGVAASGLLSFVGSLVNKRAAKKHADTAALHAANAAGHAATVAGAANRSTPVRVTSPIIGPAS